MGVFVRYFVKFFYFFSKKTHFSSSSLSIGSILTAKVKKSKQMSITIRETHTVARNISTLFAQTIATTIMIAPKNKTNILFIRHHLIPLYIPTCEQLIRFLLYTMGERDSVAFTIVLYAYRHVFQCTLKTVIMNRNIYQSITFLRLIFLCNPRQATTEIPCQLNFASDVFDHIVSVVNKAMLLVTRVIALTGITK